MKAVILFSFLVAVDNCISLCSNGLVGQLPSFLFLVLVADLVVFEVDSLIATVVQFYPRVGKLFDVIHDALDIRLHDFVDNKLCMSTVSASNE